MGTTSKRYPTEFRERAVRLAAEQQCEGNLKRKSLVSVSSKLGCTREVLQRWVRELV
jgi:transposase-like protein